MEGDDALFDRWAEFYDEMYAEQDVDDVEFYVDLATSVEGPVLELACGTGRVYLELLAAAVEAHGLDASREMLDRLERKADERDLDPTVWQDDMRAFDAPSTYAAILIPFRSFLHLRTIDDQLATLERIREHLRPGGLLALNIFLPDHGRLAEPSTTEAEFEIDGHTYQKHDDTHTSDPVAPFIETDRTLYHDGETVWETSFELKAMYKREFELLLRLAGFSDWTVFGDFDRSPVTSESTEQVWVVER